VDVIVSPAILNGDVSALDVTGLAETAAERVEEIAEGVPRRQSEKSDHRRRLLLRARRERPCRSRAEQGDELAPPDHSITSSARASSDGETSRPSAFAVLRLIASSNLVGVCTGRSPGLAPRRMRST